MLNDFRIILEANNVDWAFKFVIIDWSKPYMHALCEILNKMSFNRYLNTLYNGSRINSKTATYILSCVSRFVHMICRNCEKLLLNDSKLRSAIKKNYCLIIDCTSIDQVENLLYKSIILFFRKI